MEELPCLILSEEMFADVPQSERNCHRGENVGR